jgi:hypothetical protein
MKKEYELHATFETERAVLRAEKMAKLHLNDEK